MVRVAAEIGVASGVFATQPLVFAHLMDVDAGMDFDLVEVVQGTAMRKRLGHYFPPQVITEILVEMGADDTLVLFLPGAPLVQSVRLRRLGQFTGTLVRAR